MARLWMQNLMRWLRRDPYITLRFESRRYRLGEALDASIEVLPQRDLRVSEAYLDLVHQRSYIENSQVMVPDYLASRSTMRGGMSSAWRHPNKVLIPKRVTETLNSSYVHNSVSFLGEAMLESNSSVRYTTTLEIPRIPPPHAGEGKENWVLAATFRLPNGREITEVEPVSISLI